MVYWYVKPKEESCSTLPEPTRTLTKPKILVLGNLFITSLVFLLAGLLIKQSGKRYSNTLIQFFCFATVFAEVKSLKKKCVVRKGRQSYKFILQQKEKFYLGCVAVLWHFEFHISKCMTFWNVKIFLLVFSMN